MGSENNGDTRLPGRRRRRAIDVHAGFCLLPSAVCLQFRGRPMTPTSFEFTLTMPSDPRLVGAIRQLATQAASYARLGADAGAMLAGHVERAAEAAVEVSGGNGPIELRFSAGEGAVNVHIACEAGNAAGASPSSRGEGVSVDWSTNGSRHVCHICHRSPA